jgi:hypothetical protein
MGIEFILATFLSLTIGAIYPVFKALFEEYIKWYSKKRDLGKTQLTIAKILGIKTDYTLSYKEKLSQTLDTLKNAFALVDNATSEFTQLLLEKERNIEILQGRVDDLAKEEANLKNKVDSLQRVPLDALTHFEKILNKGEKRSAYRDYILFGLGVFVSIGITVLLKVFFKI